MITTNDGVQLGTLAALQQIVQALELRFPDHNGPFEYGTRLAEEAGELIEITNEIKAGSLNPAQKQHLLKEMQDVLRVTYGIAKLYNLTKRLPTSLNEFDAANNPKNLVSYIIQTGVRSGQLASAINHAEGMGVKKEKHGDDSTKRVYERVYALIQLIAWMVVYFKAEAEFDAQVAVAYADYKEKGFIR
jgi:NTP pyrophosphatase (non-canonical NTP hydrolase)